jgi:Domain of unknown function (DUF5615)
VRKLERLVLDADMNPRVDELLIAVGFDVVSARTLAAAIFKRDVALLQWARQQGRIVVSHDQHADKKTNHLLYPEIYHNGGKVLQVSGNPSQDVLMVVGKIILHRADWSQFFLSNNGIATVRQDKPVKLETAETLYSFIQKRMKLDIDPVSAVKSDPIPRKQRTRVERPPRAGARLIND